MFNRDDVKLIIKRIFHRPIYRIDILNWSLSHATLYSGVCCAIRNGLKMAGLDDTLSWCAFPKHTIRNALDFRIETDEDGYWWPRNVWKDSGRMDYMKWLHDQYMDDRTDLRKIL